MGWGRKQRVGAALLGMLLISMLSPMQVEAGAGPRKLIFSGCAWRHTLYKRTTIIDTLGLSASDEYNQQNQWMGPGLDDMISKCRFTHEVSDDGTTYRDIVKWWTLVDGLAGDDPAAKGFLIGAFWALEINLAKACGHPDVGAELLGTLPMGLGGLIGILRPICKAITDTRKAATAASAVPLQPVKVAASTWKKATMAVNSACTSSMGTFEGICPKGNWLLKAFRGLYKLWGLSKMILWVVDQVILPGVAAGYCRQYTDRFKTFERKHPGLDYNGTVSGCDTLPETPSGGGNSSNLISPATDTGNEGLNQLIDAMGEIKKLMEDFTEVLKPIAEPFKEVGEWAEALSDVLSAIWAPFKPLQGVLDVLGDVMGIISCPDFLGCICNLDELILGFVDDLLDKLGIPNIGDMIKAVLDAMGLGAIVDELDKLNVFSGLWNPLENLKSKVDDLTNSVKGMVNGTMRDLLLKPEKFDTPVPDPYPDPRFPGGQVYHLSVRVRSPADNPPPSFTCDAYQGVPLMVTASRRVQNCNMELSAIMRFPCNLDKSCTYDVAEFKPACVEQPPILTPQETKDLSEFLALPGGKLPIYDVFEATYMCIDLNDPVVKDKFQLLADLFTVTGEPDHKLKRSWADMLKNQGITPAPDLLAMLSGFRNTDWDDTRSAYNYMSSWASSYNISGVPLRDFMPTLTSFNAEFPGFVDCGNNGNRTIWIEAVNKPAAWPFDPMRLNDVDSAVDMKIKYPEKFDPCYSLEWLDSQDEEALSLTLPDGTVMTPTSITWDDTLVPKMKRDLCDWVHRFALSVNDTNNNTDAWGFPIYGAESERMTDEVFLLDQQNLYTIMKVPPERSRQPWINKHATFYRLNFRTFLLDPSGVMCSYDPTGEILGGQCMDDYMMFNSFDECFNWMSNVDNRQTLYDTFYQMYRWGSDYNELDFSDGGIHRLYCDTASDRTISQWVKLSGGNLTTQGLTSQSGAWNPWVNYESGGGFGRYSITNGWTDNGMRVAERNNEGMLRQMILQSYRGTTDKGDTLASPESIKKCAKAMKTITTECHGKKYCDIEMFTATACIPGVIQYSCMEDEVFNPIGYHTRIGYHFGSSVLAGEKRNISCSSPDNFAYITKADVGGAVDNTDVTEMVADKAKCKGPSCLISVSDAVEEGVPVDGQTLRVEIGCVCGAGKLPAMKTDGTCNLCPAGKFRNRNMSDCDFCPAGSYSAAGASNCTDCPAGYYSQKGDVVCNACDPGTASQGGAAECTPCEADNYSATTASVACQPCLPGMTTKGKKKSNGCVNCPSGWARENEPVVETGCQPCPRGTFMSNMTGVVKCTPCMPGYSQPSEAALMCLPCNPGSYQPSTGQASCMLCPPGKVALSSGATNCTDPPEKAVVNWEGASQLWFSQEGGGGGRRRLLSVVSADIVPAKTVGSLCDAWLASVSNVTGSTAEARISQLGNGWCNRGPWNVEVCEYDGGDCCAATCQRAVLNATGDDGGAGANGTNTNITTNGTGGGSSTNATSYIPVSCRPDTFECKDPNATVPGGWSRGELPGSPDPSQANDTCDKADKRLGDGLCQDDLNIKACGYDKGDCCYSTCKPNPLVPASCGMIDCRDPVAIAGTWVDKVAPRLMGVPVNVTVYLGTVRWREAMKTPVVTANDNDLTFNGNVTLSEVTEAGTNNTVKTITRIWTATDPSGNSNMLVQQITVLKTDPKAPIFSGVPDDINMTIAQAAAGVPNATVTASAGGQPVEVVLDTDMSPADGSCGGYILANTWTARTSDGLHEAAVTQLIRVFDDQGPALPSNLEGAFVACFRKKKFKMAEFKGLRKAGNFSFNEVVDNYSPKSSIVSKGFVSCSPAPGFAMKLVRGMPNCTYVPESDTLYVPYVSAYNITVRTLPSGKNKTVKAAAPMVFSVAWAFDDGCGNIGVATQRLIAPRTVKDLPPGMPLAGCAYTSVNTVP